MRLFMANTNIFKRLFNNKPKSERIDLQNKNTQEALYAYLLQHLNEIIHQTDAGLERGVYKAETFIKISDLSKVKGDKNSMFLTLTDYKERRLKIKVSTSDLLNFAEKALSMPQDKKEVKEKAPSQQKVTINPQEVSKRELNQSIDNITNEKCQYLVKKYSRSDDKNSRYQYIKDISTYSDKMLHTILSCQETRGLSDMKITLSNISQAIKDNKLFSFQSITLEDCQKCSDHIDHILADRNAKLTDKRLIMIRLNDILNADSVASGQKPTQEWGKIFDVDVPKSVNRLQISEENGKFYLIEANFHIRLGEENIKTWHSPEISFEKMKDLTKENINKRLISDARHELYSSVHKQTKEALLSVKEPVYHNMETPKGTRPR